MATVLGLSSVSITDVDKVILLKSPGISVVSAVFVEMSMVVINKSMESVLIGFTTIEGGAVLAGLSRIGGNVVTKVVALILVDEVILISRFSVVTSVLVVVEANTFVGLIILTVAVSIGVSIVVGSAVVISILIMSVVIDISEVVVGTAFIGVTAVRASVVIVDLGIVVSDVIDGRVPETIKHIRAKPSVLSQNPSQFLARIRRCVRVRVSSCSILVANLILAIASMR